MKYKIVSVYDTAVSVFSVPVFVASVGAAVRSFGDQVKKDDENNPLNRHPEDFQLFLVGEFDDSDGSFDGMIRPERIASAVDYK